MVSALRWMEWYPGSLRRRPKSVKIKVIYVRVKSLSITRAFCTDSWMIPKQCLLFLIECRCKPRPLQDGRLFVFVPDALWLNLRRSCACRICQIWCDELISIHGFLFLRYRNLYFKTCFACAHPLTKNSLWFGDCVKSFLYNIPHRMFDILTLTTFNTDMPSFS